MGWLGSRHRREGLGLGWGCWVAMVGVWTALIEVRLTCRWAARLIILACLYVLCTYVPLSALLWQRPLLRCLLCDAVAGICLPAMGLALHAGVGVVCSLSFLAYRAVPTCLSLKGLIRCPIPPVHVLCNENQKKKKKKKSTV